MPSLGLGLSIDKSGVVPNPIIPASLKPNALALYTTRPQGLSDFAVMISSDFTTAEMNAIFGVGNAPTVGEIAGMKAYKGKETWVGLEPVVINPNDKYYWPDRSGNNRHLHAVNVAYDATGGVQAGPPANWLCDGVNDYLVFNSQTDIVAANGAVSAFVVFQAVGSVPGSGARAVYINGAGAVNVLSSYFTSTVLIASAATTATAISGLINNPNIYKSIAYGYDSSTQKSFVSNNGSVVALSSGTTATIAAKQIIMSCNNAITSFNNNRFAEVYLFNKVLTQTEIKQLHNNVASRYGLTKV